MVRNKLDLSNPLVVIIVFLMIDLVILGFAIGLISYNSHSAREDRNNGIIKQLEAIKNASDLVASIEQRQINTTREVFLIHQELNLILNETRKH